MKKLADILEIRGTIKLITGLHIGAGKDEVKIGGMDNPVIRNPLNGEPYIPGSSLKGKVRMLLELYYGLFEPNKGDVFSYEVYRKMKKELNNERIKVAKNLLRLFGTSGSDFKDFEKLPPEERREIEEIASTRISFYDLKLTEESRKELRERIGGLMTEEKTEVKINRITGTSFGGALTSKERIPAGTKFEFKLCLKVFEGDNEEELLDLVKKGLRLLELDSLGGSGSRGYGKVKFRSEKYGEGKLECISHLKKREPFALDLSSAF
ncbi:type III-A CRISPR-associated RAMP protein Csm3 [Phorcysia thermohydrogeniphila]|uniref:CRISPR system Cms endoribonuclease Csm3 n=1 Tax=Phorcysia thermohydrogeniphila TaxID=936138 RepID=A0A4R1GGZ8_9BACT|nr:type III-A CRISPR-associated RAMP protein Csm3 [Phorcysia thermohydrogeniphila]TCK06220.1 CRISPR-associated Csm3 family protein [Phorcysia thermohydrogeniphila]